MLGSPWLSTDDMYKQLESCLGPCCPDMVDEWAMDDEFDADEMSGAHETWSDGSKIQDPVSKIETAGCWSML